MRARTHAVIAVVILSVASLGSAAPLVTSPLPETLVEGHTVFGVIETIRSTTTRQASFAAAMAVLVREVEHVDQASRAPGVAWFNYQALVAPTSGQENKTRVRHPCGGAVLVVNHGDPDPRVSILHSPNGYGGATAAADAMLWPQEQAARAAASPTFTPTEERFTPVPGANPGDGHLSGFFTGAHAPDHAWIGEDVGGPGDAAYTDVPTAVISYNESYLITDPNDHLWIIDKYTAYTRIGTPSLATSEPYSYPVWAVNILGSPIFIPDDGTLSCGPHVDLGTAHGPTGDVHVAFGSDVLPWRDNPTAPMKASSPGLCPMCPPSQARRLYNALLYMRVEDLAVAASPAPVPASSASAAPSRGCAVGAWWECHDPRAHDGQGAPHPFTAKRAPPSLDGADLCPAGFAGTSAYDHGGSTDPQARCDDVHALRRVDVYWSGMGRPFEPPVRNFAVMDLFGSTAPYHQ